MLTIEVKDINGAVIGVFTAEAKTFSTGSRGFNATGKVLIEGKKHQCGFNITEIGSKPAKA